MIHCTNRCFLGVTMPMESLEIIQQSHYLLHSKSMEILVSITANSAIHKLTYASAYSVAKYISLCCPWQFILHKIVCSYTD